MVRGGLKLDTSNRSFYRENCHFIMRNAKLKYRSRRTSATGESLSPKSPPLPLDIIKTDPEIAVRRLRRSELPVGTVALARFLIGKILVRHLPLGTLMGRIIETEAYPPRDPAAHHFRGPTPRTRSMYLSRGHAYVYFSYGNHFMLNVSSEPLGIGGGILIRALEPLQGLDHMERHRETSRLLDLTRGPGRLASALQIDRTLDGVDLCADGPLWLGVLVRPPGPRSKNSPRKTIGVSPRIGITRAADHLLRFYERDSPFVSGPVRLRS
jgi:DNA-3-methyladenine glycosylase